MSLSDAAPTHPRHWIFALWVAAVLLSGAILSSFHQPIRPPSPRILALTRDDAPGHWRAIHFLSASCGCSQRVMRHLLERRPFPNLPEQIVVLDGPAPYLPGSRQLLAALQAAGFTVTHLQSTSIPPDAGLRGVPLLVFATPENTIAYAGGYGPSERADTQILRTLQSGAKPAPLAVLGCVVGRSLQHQADPFRLKY